MSKPIAIVGIGCRFPGQASTPDAFWRLIGDGVDATSELPADRWNVERRYHADPQMPGRINTRRGGFIELPREFDAAAFGISPREAARVDPQHRLLLECAWEGLDDAGLRRSELRGSNTAVYVGQSAGDFEQLQMNDIDWIDTASATGSARSMASNRLSYLLDLHGPSLTVDTACSSSLVALHLACESLRSGESPFALAAGVNLILLPLFMSALTRLSMLAPDGRCKPFAAQADGFGRGEGCGMVVLCPLEDALERGMRIYAVIRGTSVNSDGNTLGITVPSRGAQTSLIRTACDRAGVAPGDVSYVEAHGTGTPVGDPIEAGALGDALGEGRPSDRPCLLGSVKGNIGHLEGGAGIAGLIKAALCLYHGEVPRTLHADQPNPEIAFEELGLELATTHQPWPEGPRIASVNSFGFGGTSAHTVLGEAPQVPLKPTPCSRPRVLPLSARSPEGLADLSRRTGSFLSEGEADFSGACATAGRRDPLPFRRGFVAVENDDLLAQLEAPVEDVQPAGKNAPQVVFVLCGQGPQQAGMAHELLETEPAFRAAIEECDRHMRPHAEWSLLEELSRAPEDSRVESEIRILQPALFAIQVGLVSLWRSWGIQPDAVIGHSMGEIAAGWASGGLELADACRVIVQRGRIQQAADPSGSMMAVGSSREAIQPLLDEFDGRITIGAENSPTDLTLTGDRDALEDLAPLLEAQSIFHRSLAVLCACHSHHMDPLREDLLDSLDGLQARQGIVPHLSTVTGATIDGRDLDHTYWWRCFREPVAFAPALHSMGKGDDNRIYLEIGPHPVLSHAIHNCLDTWNWQGTVLPSLQRNVADGVRMRQSLARLWELGLDVDWAAAGSEGPQVALPHTPWDREEHWCERPSRARERLRGPAHPLLGDLEDGSEISWSGLVSRQRQEWASDHRVQDQVVVPAAAFVDAAACAARQGIERVMVEDLRLSRALFLPQGVTSELHAHMDAQTRKLVIRTRNANQNEPGSWTEHVTARVLTDDHPLLHPPATLRTLQQRLTETMSADRLYALADRIGLNYGPRYRRLDSLMVGQGEALGHVRALGDGEAQPGFGADPALLDACFQTVLALTRDVESDVPYLPVSIASVRNTLPIVGDAHAYVQLRRHDEQALVADIWIFREDGHPAWELRGFTCRALEGDNSRALNRLADHMYSWSWEVETVDTAAQSEEAESNDVMLPAPRFLPAPLDLAERMRASLDGLRETTARDAWQRTTHPAIERVALEFLVQALVQLGWSAEPGQVVRTSDLLEEWSVDFRHWRRLDSWLRILAGADLLEPCLDGWRVLADLPEVDALASWRDVIEHHPACFAEAILLHRAGTRLAAILTDEVDALDILFGGADDSTTSHVYRDAPACRIFNLLIAEALRGVAECVPVGRPLRVLELGAGTGGLTAHALRVLPSNGVDYLFTDISPVFLSQAQTEFSMTGPGIRTALLDLNLPLEGQEVRAAKADVVLASNCLHATRDVLQSLKRVRRLLAPNGMLVLLEALRPTRWLDLVFGLTEQWWGFEDTDRRSTSALLNEEGWREVLQEAGFTSVEIVGDTHAAEDSAQAVIMARVPDTALALEPPAPEVRGDWLVLADQGDSADPIIERLEVGGGRCLRVDPGPTRLHPGQAPVVATADLPGVLPELLGCLEDLRGVIVLRTLDASGGSWQEPLHATLHTLQTMVRHQASAANTWVFTRPIDELGAEDQALAQGGVWGLTRTTLSEHPDLPCTLVSWPMIPTREDHDALLSELLNPSPQEEIAFVDGVRLVHRMRSRSLAELGSVETSEASSSAAVDTDKPGVLEALALVKIPRREPGPAEVEIAIEATALNFKDVMGAMGMLDVETLEIGYSGRRLGMECSGRVSAVGADIEHVRVGQRVVAFAPDCLAKHVVTVGSLVAPLAETVDCESAVTVPVSFMTAWYALHDLGRMRAGEWVLIHSAAGGLGLAALQLARAEGAKVIATAGTPEKRALLRALGIEHVFDSRSLAFPEEVRQATAGKGVDIVLNALAGESLVRSIDLLAPFGRFLEVGKRDIYGDTPVGLRPFRNNISFFAIDLDAAMRADLPRFAGLFQEIIEKLGDGRIRPLPHRPFPLGQAAEAFRFMAQGRHVGKIVLSVDGTERPDRAPAPDFDPDAVALITGGLGGFGLALARWLGDHGARHLVLVGRSGASDPEASAAVDDLRSRGIEVTVEAADVSKASALSGVLDRIRDGGRPLKYVFHAAMVLRDVAFEGLDTEALAAVMEPKVNGAWNLHELTVDDPIEQFVLFSSVSALVGGSGQANYAAANTALAALAHLRTRRDMPGLAVDWGALEGLGWVARHQDIGERLARQGLRSFTADEALWSLGQLLQRPATQVGVVDADWSTWFGNCEAPPRFAELAQASATSEKTATESNSLARIYAMPVDERPPVIRSMLVEQAAHVLAMSPARLSSEMSLSELGMDSLMAVEFRHRVNSTFRVELTVAELLQGPPLCELVNTLINRMPAMDAA